MSLFTNMINILLVYQQENTTSLNLILNLEIENLIIIFTMVNENVFHLTLKYVSHYTKLSS